MTQTRTETIALTDGSDIRVTVAEPEDPPRGGLVLLHDSSGAGESLRKLVGVLATEGWLTVAPHLPLAAGGPPDIDEPDAEPAAAGTVPTTAADLLVDVDAVSVWLTDQGVQADQIGLLGFGFGGVAAFTVAATRSVGAVVTVSAGGIVEPAAPGLAPLADIASELSSPWLGIYGDQDAEISVEQVEKLRESAAGAQIAVDVVRFEDADHRFDNDQEAAAEAWQRTLNWFDAHLR
ncbi:dienelactone hydrolase family protein [Actinoalloteichus hymeniacidonis]|uniref:Dienelactone hydrolase-like enzyme n=1 Tax=Actinoalloteichus hymeniacidonis TaxID=340345 RepID=A0AAC9MV97_9PSEU|nr:dienelactone hydrolase family protein [Actinoalloteichus hymeniacidonis]AOS61003.1 dienelactone hydrolase-like enzyme [Actinoalloteichus hymeniacidonis]MBB5910997.1 carboxymethylenebutenolidase [Actinoalloteichus hymeniacidonis]